MANRGIGHRALDGLVALTALLALFFLVRERVLPWIADRSVLDPGDVLRDAPGLIDARTGGAVSLEEDSGHLVLVFRSTCAACERAVPGWRRLGDDGRWNVTAVGLEGRETALAYADAHLPGTRTAVPLNMQDFTRRFRIDVVPTTLVIDRGGRLAARHAGPLEEQVIEAIGSGAFTPQPKFHERRSE